MDMKKIEDIMSAITFAEAGEHEKAKEFLRSRKTVLLAISDTLFDKNALKYAMNITKRIGGNLEILYVTEDENEKAGLKDFISQVKEVGFNFSIVVKMGCMKKAILDYTDKRNEIQFVIVGSTPELDAGCRTGERTFSDAWKKMKCPLVLVSRNEVPSAA